MIAELKAMQAAVTAAGVPAYIGQVPSAADYPYASLTVPGFDVTDSPALVEQHGTIAPDVRLHVTHTSETNVHAALGIIRAALVPALGPTALTVPGRHVVIEWLRPESVATKRDVTLPGTNAHPAVGVETYRITSQPA